jgi:hypothetical protein
MASNVNDYSTFSSASVLNSWKEIASYLGRGIRTVQRYERECRLPVRRLPGKPRSSVLALRQELDRWVRETEFSDAGAGNDSPTVHLARIQELLMRSAQLCDQNRALRDQTRKTILNLMSAAHAVGSALTERQRVTNWRLPNEGETE